MHFALTFISNFWLVFYYIDSKCFHYSLHNWEWSMRWMSEKHWASLWPHKVLEVLQQTTEDIRGLLISQGTENKESVLKILKGVCCPGKSLCYKPLYWPCLSRKAGLQLYLVALLASKVVFQSGKWFEACWLFCFLCKEIMGIMALKSMGNISGSILKSRFSYNR